MFGGFQGWCEINARRAQYQANAQKYYACITFLGETSFHLCEKPFFGETPLRLRAFARNLFW
jgi:hypothetical protein